MMRNELYFVKFRMFREKENMGIFVSYHFAKQSSMQPNIPYRFVRNGRVCEISFHIISRKRNFVITRKYDVDVDIITNFRVLTA